MRRRGVGRPPLGDNARIHSVNVKLTAVELATWRAQAKAEGIPFTRWLLVPCRELEKKP